MNHACSRRCGLVVQPAITPTRKGARLIPNPGTPSPTLGIRCFIPLPGSGWQVLFDLKNGSIGSEKSDTLQKIGGGTARTQSKKKIMPVVMLLRASFSLFCRCRVMTSVVWWVMTHRGEYAADNVSDMIGNIWCIILFPGEILH